MSAVALDRDVVFALRRAAVYRLLGGAFAYPTAPRLAELADLAGTVADAIEEPSIQAALSTFADAAAATSPDVVAAEYVFLFDGAVRCSPWEGAYGDAPQLAGKGAMLADIGGFYEAFGLTPSGVQSDSVDHIAAELELMSALALKEAYAVADAAADGVEITRGAATAFIRDHLGRWAEAFSETVAGASSLPYYSTAAALLNAWVHADAAALGVATDRVSLGAVDPLGAAEPFTCPIEE
jgi:TorA maturation chaperone TorD